MNNFRIALVIFTLSGVNAEKKIWDLTWSFDHRSVYWPGHKQFEFTDEVVTATDDYTSMAKEFCAAEHGGTHFDAPIHFHKGGWSVSEVPIKHLIVKGTVIDLGSETEKSGADTLLLPRHLTKWEEIHGEFPENCVLLVRFGWSRYYHDKAKYLGIKDDDNTLSFPGISKEAAEWIVKTGKFVGVGLDTASTDSGSNTEFPTHQILAKNRLYGLENVHIPEDLPATGFDLYVMPMKIEEGTGAPVRILARQV